MTDLDHHPGARSPVPEPTARPAAGQRPGSPVGLAALVGLIVLAGISGSWPLLVMIGAIVVMIFLHELGHFITAKWAGMKVTEFFIGFGPRIWSFRRGETEYGIKAIPAGAYVKIVGMHNLDEYDPADADRTYMSKPYWRRLSVAVAGSTMHFLLALVSLFALFAFIGVPGGRIATSEAEEDRLFDTAPWVVGDISPDTAAERAGLRPGDDIVALDEHAIEGFGEFTDLVRARPGERIVVTVVRDGAEVDVDATLAERNPAGERVGFFGVGPRFPEQTLSAADAASQSVETFGDGVGATFEGLGRFLSPSGLADLGQRVVSGPDEDAPVIGDGEATGTGSSRSADDRPVSIIGITRIGADLFEDNGVAGLLGIFITLNIFIGIFNLVPLLPLDGGHVAIATYEKLRSLRRGGEPYHVDVAKLLPLTYAVVLVLVFVFFSTVYLDVADPITVGG